MKLLALLHSPAASGSDTTIRRIAGLLEAAGHGVTLVPASDDPSELARTAKRHGADALLGTHAVLSGVPFLEAGMPFVIVLGGTDINEYTLDPDHLAQMTEVVEQAAGLVAFNSDFVDRCVSLWPEAAEKVHLIPQSVRTSPSSFSLRQRLGAGPDAKLLLLPSGLRLVKDPLFLVDAVRKWHAEDPRVQLVITGLSYDEDYEGIVLRRSGPGPAVRYIGTLDQDDLHAAMLESVAVLNTSVSECSPNSLLEAMDLGRPVVARNIPGNACLIEHGHTGLLFDDPEGFRTEVQRLLDDELLAGQIGRRGRDFVRRTHSPLAERAAYAAVFRDLLGTLPPDVDAGARDRIVRANGVDLCVQTFGDPADPAVLLIAGTSASMLAWETEFCERLAAEARYVIRYDHRDTGRSVSHAPGIPPYTVRDLAADAIGVLDALGVDRAHLAGISMGGMIAQLAALDHPDRVASLTLLSTSPGQADPEQDELPELPGTALSVLIELDDIDVPDFADRDSVIEQHVASARVLAGRTRAFDEAAARRLAGRVFDRAPAVLPSTANHLYVEWGEPWRGRLGEVRVPALVVHGALDLIYPVAHAHALAAEIPDAALHVLADAGHELARPDWENVIAALVRHTDRTERRSSRATARL